MRSLIGWMMVGLVAAACGGGAKTVGNPFNTKWENDGGETIAAVEKRLRPASVPTGVPLAVGVTANGLVAVGLDGSGQWKHGAKLDARPVIAGDVVVASGGGEVFALEARSGTFLWTVSSDGLSLRGAGDDGETTVVGLAPRNGSIGPILAIDRSGDVVRRFTPDTATGSPAIKGGVALVPWATQYVSAIDVASGEELGRLLLRERVSHAVNIGGELYFGEIGLVRFDDRIGLATQRQANSVRLPERELPGKPEWFTDGRLVTPAGSSARDRIQLFARPAETEGSLGIDSDHYAASYFRVIMGLHAIDGTLSWVRTMPVGVIGGAAAVGGFVLCDRAGFIRSLAADTGAESGQVSLGESVASCTVSAADFQVAPGKPTGTLSSQIAGAIEVRDTGMAAVQRFLLRELGTQQDADATKGLVALASNPRTPPALIKGTRSMLAARRVGAEHMLEALERHYDFLSDVLRPPPVGPIADALAAMGEQRAAPLLASHLNDPADTPDDVKRTARALVTLATPNEYKELTTFFSLYRGTADRQELVAATVSVAEAILKVGGSTGSKVIQRAASDPLTLPEVRRELVDLTAG